MTNLNKENIILSKLSNQEKKEFIEYIRKIKLEYLDSIDLSPKLHFGIEIETENGFNDTIINYMKKNYNAIILKATRKLSNNDFSKWQINHDGSLINGIELSSPILSDETKTWQSIKRICNTLKKYKAKATDHTGAHIHFNVTFLENDIKSFIRLLQIYMIYENIFIKFGYGKTGNPRSEIFKYASPIAPDIFLEINTIKKLECVKDLSKWVSHSKNKSMNFKNVYWNNITSEYKNTIEFRSSNGTINPIEWQNLINSYAHLLMVAKNPNIDIEYLNYKMFSYFFKNYQNKAFYQVIYIDEALELVDLLFDNLYYKICFLKQYFGINLNHRNDFQKILERVGLNG